MSNELAIAACTSTLRHVLQDWFNNSGMTAEVTTLPLDRASQDNPTNRVNLFLYHMLPNAAWRNQPIPQRGENSNPPLALNLYYLLTAYGDDVNGGLVEETDHKLLGHAMTVFHDRPVLDAKDIRDATNASDGASGPAPVSLNQSDLHKQTERIRITPEPLNLDELMKLWGTFHQSPYRISAAYQASVVLLESRGSTSSPFPVLARGENDIGPDVDPALRPASIEWTTGMAEPHNPLFLRLESAISSRSSDRIYRSRMQGWLFLIPNCDPQRLTLRRTSLHDSRRWTAAPIHG